MVRRVNSKFGGILVIVERSVKGSYKGSVRHGEAE